jgi:hypothetical protein
MLAHREDASYPKTVYPATGELDSVATPPHA